MKVEADPIIQRYLTRLREELRSLPPSQGNEIVEEVAGHIEEALNELTDPSEADVRRVLDEVGDPHEIASEAASRLGVERGKPSWADYVALVLLPIGGILVPIIGWIAGVILLWMSAVWRRGEKLVGTFVLPGGLMLPFWMTFMGRVAPISCVTLTDGAGRVLEESCTQVQGGLDPRLALAIVILLVLIQIGSTAYLISRLLRSRRMAM